MPATRATTRCSTSSAALAPTTRRRLKRRRVAKRQPRPPAQAVAAAADVEARVDRADPGPGLVERDAASNKCAIQNSQVTMAKVVTGNGGVMHPRVPQATGVVTAVAGAVIFSAAAVVGQAPARPAASASAPAPRAAAAAA